MKSTLVLGASDHPGRVSYRSAQEMMSYGQRLVLVGKRKSHLAGIDILDTTVGILPGSIDTVSVYLNPQNQKMYYAFLLELKPKRIIFNPGSENSELAQLARNQGIEVLFACSQVMMSLKQY